jgi:hypothetical protein
MGISQPVKKNPAFCAYYGNVRKVTMSMNQHRLVINF